MANVPASWYETLTVEAGDVVSVADFKLYARIDTSADDALISDLLATAESHVEDYTGRTLRTITARGHFDSLGITGENWPFVELQRSPFRSVQSVTVWTGSALQPVTNTTVKQRPGYARVLFSSSQYVDWISRTDWEIQVEFTAGFGVANVPQVYRTAIKALALNMYGNRGDCADERGLDLKPWLGGERIMRAFA